MLKEAVLRTGCLAVATAAAGRGDLALAVLAERLMLAIYAYGTNTGIRAIAGSSQSGHSEDDNCRSSACGCCRPPWSTSTR
jgi:hypothetical protein